MLCSTSSSPRSNAVPIMHSCQAGHGHQSGTSRAPVGTGTLERGLICIDSPGKHKTFPFNRNKFNFVQCTLRRALRRAGGEAEKGGGLKKKEDAKLGRPLRPGQPGAPRQGPAGRWGTGLPHFLTCKTINHCHEKESSMSPGSSCAPLLQCTGIQSSFFGCTP